MADERRLSDRGAERLRRPNVAWWIVGFALLAVVVWIVIRYLAWIVFGLFIYYVGRPITRRIGRRFSSRPLSAGLTLVFILVPVLVFLAVFLAVALGQALDLLSSEAVISVVDRLPISTTDLPTDPVEVAVLVFQDPELSSILGQFGVVVGAFTTTLFNLFLSIIFAFFLLVEDVRLARWFEANILGPDSRGVEYLRGVDRGLTSVYFGYTLTIFVVIILAAVIYNVFNLVAPPGLQIPSAMLLAVVTGVFTLIPLVGRTIVYALIVGLVSIKALEINPALLWIPILFLVLMVVVFDNVVRTYIRPSLSGKAYPMGLVMFAYLLGPALFGWYGIFMGPLVMVLVVEYVVYVLPQLAGFDSPVDEVPEEESDVPRVDNRSAESDEYEETDQEESPSE